MNVISESCQSDPILNLSNQLMISTDASISNNALGHMHESSFPAKLKFHWGESIMKENDWHNNDQNYLLFARSSFFPHDHTMGEKSDECTKNDVKNYPLCYHHQNTNNFSHLNFRSQWTNGKDEKNQKGLSCDSLNSEKSLSTDMHHFQSSWISEFSYTLDKKCPVMMNRSRPFLFNKSQCPITSAIERSSPAEEIYDPAFENQWKRNFEQYELELSTHPSSSHLNSFKSSDTSLEQNGHSFDNSSQWLNDIIYRTIQDDRITELEAVDRNQINNFISCPFANEKYDTSKQQSFQQNENYDISKWSNDYYRNIDHLIDEEGRNWLNLSSDVKLWKKYSSQGYGYEGFGLDYFQNYSFEQDSTKDPPSNILSIEELVRLCHNGNIFDALEALEECLQHNSVPTESIQRWTLLAEVNIILGRDSQAICSYHQILNINKKENIIPFSTDYYASLAHLQSYLFSVPSLLLLSPLYVNEKCIPEALISLSTYLYSNIDKYPHWKPFSNLKTTPDALFDAYFNAVKSSYSLGHVNVDLQNGLSIILFIMEKYDLATDCLSVCVNEDPKNYILQSRLGSLHLKTKRFNEAEACYQKAIDLCPSYINPKRNLVILYLEQGKQQGALGLARNVLSDFPPSCSKQFSCELEEVERIMLESMQNFEQSDY